MPNRSTSPDRYLVKKGNKYWLTKWHEGKRIVLPLDTTELKVARERRDQIIDRLPEPEPEPFDPDKLVEKVLARLADDDE